MSKAFDYTVITKIKNRDFLMYQKGLDTQSLDALCSKIDAFLCAGQYNEACQNLRIANENITRYLYTRLVKRYMPNDIGTTMALSALRKKLNEDTDALQGITLITHLENLNKPLNKYHHPEKVTAADAQADAGIYPPNFVNMLEILVPYVNERLAAIEPSLKIEYKFEPKFNESGKKYYLQELRANLQNVDNRSKYQYSWYYEQTGLEGYELLQPGNYYYKLAGQKWLIGKCIKLTAFNSETGHTLSATYGPITSEQVEYGPSKSQETSNNGNSVTSSLELTGRAIIEPNLKSKEYDLLPLIVSSLEDSNISLQQQGIHFRWGFVKRDESLFTLFEGREFKCKLDKGIGKVYRCEITCEGFNGKIISSNYPLLTEDDFQLPLIGSASITPELCNKEPYHNDFVLKANFVNNNISGKPNYTWVYADKRIDSGNDSRHIISEADVGTEFTCEITHPKRKGAISTDPFLVTSDTIEELTKKALKQNDAEKINFEENETDSKPSAEETVKQGAVSATEPIQHNDIAALEREPAHRVVPESFDGHTTAIYQKNERFNSLGKIYYFVCNDSERFVLNSLEEVSYRDYLYQLLREHGYDRVVIVCDEEELHRAYAFEDETKNAVVNSSTSSSPLGGMLRKKVNSAEKTAEKEAASSCHIGARIITEIISEKTKTSVGGSNHVTFSQFVNTYLRKLIVDSKIKTAIAMPISLLKRDMNESLANDIRQKLDASKGNNIIVLTANTVEDLGDLLSLADAFGTLDSDIKKARGIAQNRAVSHYHAVSAILEGYEDENRKKKVENAKNRLIECYSNLGIDEVANYISREKYIKADHLFDSLKPTEIYSFAEKIVEELRESKNAPTFEAIHYFFSEKQDKITKILYRDKLWIRMPIEMNGIPSTALSRVEGSVERYQLSEEERQAIRAEANDSLDKMIGLSSVKTQINDLNAYSKVFGGEQTPGHYVFAGNPGTGKTVVARLMGKLLHAEGLLNTDRVKEVSKEDLVSENVGGTAMKTAKVCEDALDGVLFVDEAYQLVNTESVGETFPDHFCEEAYTTLMRFMENNRDRICVIFAGYTDKMQMFVEANPGMKSRISNTIVFPDYSDNELLEIIKLEAKEKHSKMKENLQLSEEYISALRDALGDIRKDEEFANGRTMRLILEQSIGNAARRIYNSGIADKSLIGADLPENYRPDNTPQVERDRAYLEAMAELNHMIGLKPVKDELETLLEIKKVFPDEDGPGNYVFAGRPGTGKTTVARMLGRILKAQGLLNTENVVEVSGKTDLVGTVVGESGKKTLAKCKEALNGILFIDEAYSLVNCDEGVSGTYPDSYCEEAYMTILQFMENNRGRICVIFAGYKNKMEKFVAANEGMGSRISKVIDFPDYTDAELVEIFTILAEKEKIQLSPEFSDALKNAFAVKKDEEELKARKTGRENAFGNAREARKLLNLCKGSLAKRVLKEGLKEWVLLLEDLPEEYKNIHTEPPVPKPIYKRIPAALIQDLPNPFNISFPSEDTVLGPETEKAILFVKTDRGAGTAFLISPDGYAITCAHVIADKATSKEYGNYKARMLLDARYETRAEMWFGFEVVNMDVNVDMALIYLHCGMEQNEFLQTHHEGAFPYIKLAQTAETLKKGSKCIEQGYPFGDTMANDCSQDPVSIKSFQRDSFGEYISLAGEAKCGNSGSPVISLETGLAVGVVNGSITNENDKLTEEVNYMRPIQYFWSEFTN